LSLLCGEQKRQNLARVNYWEIIARNLKKRGWSYGYVSAVDSQGRTIWIADAHRDGQRFVVRADEKLTAFLELESAIRSCGELDLTRWRDFCQARRR
jgi:hypothetical protein